MNCFQTFSRRPLNLEILLQVNQNKVAISMGRFHFYLRRLWRVASVV